MVKIGVLSLQGDFLEHIQILREMNVEVSKVKKPNDLVDLDALIIPGGESTTIGRLMEMRGLVDPVREFAKEARPIMGTCAGAVLLAKSAVDKQVGEVGQPLLALMDIKVVRNFYGRSKKSFIARVHIEEIGDVEAAFIRAPAIVEAWNDAKILGFIEHPDLGKTGVAAKQGNILAITFHPEITGDKKIYKYLVELAKK